MDKFAIKERVDFIKETIKNSVDNFVLNKEIKQYRKELHNLQKKCPHEFVNGECIYCGKEEKKDDTI